MTTVKQNKKITITISSKIVAIFKGLIYTILTILGFYYDPLFGIILFLSLIFIYELLEEKKIESVTNGKIYFYMFSLIVCAAGLVAFITVIK